MLFFIIYEIPFTIYSTLIHLVLSLDAIQESQQFIGILSFKFSLAGLAI